jgi:integrase
MIERLYGTGMRVGECCMPRLRDLDFNRKQIVMRAEKGVRLIYLPSRDRKAEKST